MEQDGHSEMYSEIAQSTSHMFPNASGFGIQGSQLVNVHGNMNINPMIPLMAPGEATGMVVPNTPSSQTTVFSESGNYSIQLLYQGRGFPLYVPGPRVNLPVQYRREGVAIGDVGRIAPEGNFDFFFNIYLPAEHPINANVPEGFVPLSPYDLIDVDHSDFDPGNYVASPSIQEITGAFSESAPGGEFIFNCAGPKGAVLALPHGAHLEKLDNLAVMRQYAVKHAESWYKYVNETRGRGLVNGSLYLITGCEKAKSWGMASFHDVALQNGFQLSFRPTTDAEAGYRYRWQGTHCRHKHADSSLVDGTPLNQTTFIHAFTISLGEGIRGKLFGNVEICQLVDSPPTAGMSGRGFVPFGSQSSSFTWSLGIFGSGSTSGGRHCVRRVLDNEDGVISDAAPIPKIFHPSQIIHERILREVPHARVVITHDDDWRDVFKEDGMRMTAQTSLELQEAIFDRFELIEDNDAIFLRAKSEPTPPENEYTPEIDLCDRPSSAETVDLSSPFPASDELPIDQLNIGGVDITAEGGSIARLLEFNNIQDQKLHATDFDIQTASSSHLGLVDSSRCEWMAGPDESFAALDQLRRSTSRSTTPSPAWAWIIRPEELDLEDGAHLGGRIAQGKWRNSLVIVKVLSKQAEASALHERGELWTSLRHPNVLQMFGISPMDADPHYAITQFQPNGNVLGFLQRNPNVDRTKIVYDTVLGMKFLHERGIVHGSLKPSNILIGGDGKACISDYGMIEVQTSGSHGHRYFSPEAWKGTISRPSDVFAWAMSALEIFTSKAPWGILSEKQIFRLVVRQDSRPDRPDEDFGLTDHIWGVMEECWHRESRLRPTFDILAQLLQRNIQISPEFRSKTFSVSRPEEGADNRESLLSDTSRALSMMSQVSTPPAYEVLSNPHPGSAPPKVSQFRVPSITPPNRTPPDFPHPPRPQYAYGGSDAASKLARYHDDVEENKIPPPMFNRLSSMPQSPDRKWLATSPSVRTSSSDGSSRSALSAWTSASGGSSPWPNRLREIGEEAALLEDPRTEYTTSTSTAMTSLNASAESVRSKPSTVSTATAPNAKLLAGALLSEVKEGRKQDVIDPLLIKIQNLGVKSHKDAQRLVTAGTVPSLILLLKTRAATGHGLETVLIALGILTHDPITANMIYRTGTTTTLIEIVNAAQSENIAALAVWCLSRMCRNMEIINGLLKQNIARLLVSKGLRAGNWRTARAAAWCLGALIQTDGIADTLADMGLIPTLCEHMRRCFQSVNASPEDHSAAIYAVARMSRSIKIAKALANGGCAELLVHCLITAEDPHLLLWSARGVGCLMRPNSSDIAKVLLDAGVARGLARLPSILPSEEVEPLGAFAFAIQRFSCTEWGGGTRKALVDAGVVDSLLAALRTAADEPYPQVHIELANAIALLGDIGGTSIRKEIVNAGGIELLKRVGSSTARPDVTKACNQAATSITGNVWSRNAASAKAALAHEWSGGCPDYFPECPVPVVDVWGE